MKNNYLISGSFAYDTILSHAGEFHARILPESIARLNVAFGVSDVNHDFGGTGGNIAYNSGLLKDNPVLIGSLGADANDYLIHLSGNGLNINTLTIHGDDSTAHAWILSDSINNQITAFNAGAMRKMPTLPEDTPNLWHLAPDNHKTTATLAAIAIQSGKKFFFDPGQALPGFIEGDAKEILPLSDILTEASGIFVNEYEAELLVHAFNEPLSHWLKDDSQFIIKTMGGQGLELITLSGTTLIPAAQCYKVVDPTGCGDAFRAGFLHGCIHDLSLIESAKLGAAMGSFAIEQAGGQKHFPTLEMANSRASSIQECNRFPVKFSA